MMRGYRGVSWQFITCYGDNDIGNFGGASSVKNDVSRSIWKSRMNILISGHQCCEFLYDSK